MKYFNCLIFLVFTTGQICLSQSFDPNDLLGTWELVNEENDSLKNFSSIIEIPENEDSVLQMGNNERQEVFLFFQKGNMLDFVQTGEQFKANYSLQDSILTLGLRTYKLLNLTEDNLTYLEASELSISPTTYYYKKSSKIIEALKEKEVIKKSFDSGQLKLLGLKEHGFRTGIWTEWYPNGNVKNVSHFNNESLLMKIEFNDKGEVISRTRLNFNTGTYIKE